MGVRAKGEFSLTIMALIRIIHGKEEYGRTLKNNGFWERKIVLLIFGIKIPLYNKVVICRD